MTAAVSLISAGDRRLTIVGGRANVAVRVAVECALDWGERCRVSIECFPGRTQFWDIVIVIGNRFNPTHGYPLARSSNSDF